MKQIKDKISTLLRNNKNKKITAIEIKRQIFPPFKKTNPTKASLIIQRAILRLLREGKAKIVDSRSNRYVTKAEIKAYLMKNNIKIADGINGIKGIDELSIREFFYSPHGRYVELT